MAGKKRGKPAGGHDNEERWLLTYADMITLLVAFFIMLYAMSVMNVTKFQQLAISVRSGFGSSMAMGAPTIINVGGGINSSPAIVAAGHNNGQAQAETGLPVPPQDLAKMRDSDRLDKAYALIKKMIAKEGLQAKMVVNRNDLGLVITVLTDKMLFPSGNADLQSESMPLLDKIAGIVNVLPNQVRVEGHTDDRPISTARFPSNWELSTTRATTVLRYFESHGIASQRLEAAGYADQHPVVPNTSDHNRARNRRVEIVVLKLADSQTSGP
jgi:chemotaxis protein MotB